ncbi:hypothetical protein GCM10022403_024510 [Streptomyces coacervatus]|uniref:DUF2252 domain-containing protein n=1 Tax=Streptomyces coacervatus TaxID=647381 RepID=A0ABP7HA77_9ACTN
MDPAVDRHDPVAVLERQGRDRLPELLPIRYGRMAASPSAFLRGAAAVMAADLASRAHTGLTVQLCGDAHLLNFGLYASPERALLFDLNDFDETFPGPFEWDVQRLAASVAVAGRANGHSEDKVRRATLEAAAAYRTAMRRLARRGELAVCYERIEAEQLLPLARSARRRRDVEYSLTRARRRTSLQAVGKLTEVIDGRRRIIQDPPLLQPAGACDRSRRPGSPYWRSICRAGRTFIPGIGSSQVSGCCRRRVTSSWGGCPGPGGRAFYWRQLRDMKGSADVAGMSPADLLAYARLCGTALARAHARSGDRIAIAAYLGGADTFEQAVADFALAYADQTAADHATLGAAIAAGVVRAAPES